VLRRANLAQAGDEKDLRIPSYSFFHMFNLFPAVFPEIFPINATLILLIHGVVFSTSKKYDYPPSASNVGWLGLPSVVRLGGQRASECEGFKSLSPGIAPSPNACAGSDRREP
jgi:hypothetical protein